MGQAQAHTFDGPLGRFTEYDPRYLNVEASRIAREKVARMGGGAIVGRVTWVLLVHGRGVTLKASFGANLKDGNCGAYSTGVAL